MAVAVKIAKVSKRFRLYHERYSSLKERIIHGGKIPYDDFWALRDIDYEIKEGQTLGILGRNGSGKSTLLKCIAGILQPTSGEILVRGQLAAMLELGAGFQPELSGRDNIFLNGSLLGLSRREIEKRFDDIVAFAELEQFIDNQVKYYSSGMYVRLGFAVAVNVEPDVLLVDEVLAVGDENFQHKCLDKVKQFQNEGRTIIFVSHSVDLVRQVCDSALVLGEGRLLGTGSPGEMARLFRDHLLEYGTLGAEAVSLSEEKEDGCNGADTAQVHFSKPIKLLEVSMQHPGFGERSYLLPGEPLTIEVLYEAVELLSDVVFSLAIHDSSAQLIFGSDTEELGEVISISPGKGRVLFHFESVPLFDGEYSLNIGIRSLGGITYDWKESWISFKVVNPGRANGLVAMPLRIEVATTESKVDMG
ncbi:MAG: ABC transporter ATP-binding protein [Actinobacteria bacterium]|jgi:ABC-2 type transport system ATP-binding protein|nr:ABC transporter ATP-binding protein [Actinomycetota bacterium]MCL6096042.1 ABC transporter ATP-binding protein [Actinomycetota bacterium]